MERHDHDLDAMKDPRHVIRLNSLVELKYFVMALIYQHKQARIDAENYDA